MTNGPKDIGDVGGLDGGEIVPMDTPPSGAMPPEPPHVGTPIGAAVERMRQRIADRISGKWKVTETPFDALNSILGGGFEQGVHVLVGGTGSGKSSLAVQCAMHAALAGHPVAYVSLELELEQVAARMVAELHNAKTNDPSKVAYWSSIYRGGSFAGFDLDARCRELSDLPITLDVHTSSGWRASFLHSIAAEARKGGDVTRSPLVVLDYLQLVGEEEDVTRPDARTRIGRAAGIAHHIAIEHQAAVILVSSVARGFYGVVGGNQKDLVQSGAGFGVETPKKGDRADVGELSGHPLFNSDALVGMGKESGEIEFNATTVINLIKAPYKDEQKHEHGRLMAVAVAKSRPSSPGWMPVRFNGARFTPGSTADADAFRKATRPDRKKPENAASDDNGSGSRFVEGDY